MTRTAPARLAAILLIAATAAPLAGCATYPVGLKDAPATVAGMTAAADEPGAGPATPGAPGYQALALREVKGGGQWNPLMTSNIGADNFTAALAASLKNLNYQAPGEPRYALTAIIEGVDRPIAGLEMSVTMKVRYTVRPAAGGDPVFTDLVAATGDSKASGSLMAADRLRVANEAAARANIAEFTRRLKAAWK